MSAALRQRLKAWQLRRALVPDGRFGSECMAEVERMEEEAVTAVTPLVTVGCSIPWYHSALGEVGVAEKVGADHDQRVLEYLSITDREKGGNLGKWAISRDETPWCAAFVGWCLLRAGLSPTRSALARSYLDYGTQLDAPVKGAIAVLTRPGGGHVGFVDRVDGSRIYLLGGNQRNRVSIRPYSKSRVIGYRWPLATVRG